MQFNRFLISVYSANVFLQAGISHCWIMFISITANTFLMPFFLIQGLGYSAAKAGLLYAAISAISLVVAPVAGRLSEQNRFSFVVARPVLLLLAWDFSPWGAIGCRGQRRYRFCRGWLSWNRPWIVPVANASSIIGAVSQRQIEHRRGNDCYGTADRYSSGMAIMGSYFCLTVRLSILPC